MTNEKELESGHGRKNNQKLKPYLVLQYLLRYTDEDNVASASDIIDFLDECGIYAERRSIYRDIEDINRIMWLLENESSVEEAEAALAADDTERLVQYDRSRKGFFVRQPRFDLDDIRILAECVYSAKFISQGQAERLVDVITEFVSVHQADKIKQNSFLTDRVKTNNKQVLNNISHINEAVSTKKHTPEQISFKYLKCSINNVNESLERRNGSRYVVSPYKLLINEGNYYLLAFESRSQKIKTYRVDRMKDVQLLGKPREGAEAFAAVEIETYAQRTFSMFGGDTQRVTIYFINPLLDTVVDRFGTANVTYGKVDDNHFSINTKVNVSEQFFSWLCSFGKRARLVSPAPVVEEFRQFLDKIRNIYE